MTMTPAQRAYEAKRAAKAGVSLERWLAGKADRQQEQASPARPDHRAGLTRDHLRQMLSDEVFHAGSALHRYNGVRSASLTPSGMAIGQVLGNRYLVHEVRAKLIATPSGMEIEGSCSCHRALPCEHMAALLIDLAAKGQLAPLPEPAPKAQPSRQPPQKRAPALGPIEDWLARLSAVVSKKPSPRWVPTDWPSAPPQSAASPGDGTLLFILDHGDRDGGFGSSRGGC